MNKNALIDNICKRIIKYSVNKKRKIFGQIWKSSFLNLLCDCLDGHGFKKV